MRGLRSLLHRCLGHSRISATTSPLPRPEIPVCIIGDIHGRADLLGLMLTQIKTRAAHAPVRILFVGDMIDRGPASAAVLNQIYTLTQAHPEHTLCLMGNHERMMLDFLTDPAAHGPRWLAAGGADTLASFGLSPWRTPVDVAPEDRLPELADQLRSTLPAGMLAWLEALPLIWQEGSLFVTHAALDPERAPNDQDPDTLLWGHRAFLRQPRRDGLWVVHGHTIFKAPTADNSRIAVDTGAWRSGRLSAAWLDHKGLEFLESTVSKR